MTYLAFDIRKFLVIKPGTPNPTIEGSAYNQGVFGVFWPIIKNIYIITGIILFFFIIIGGLGMIINAGNAEKQKQSSKTLGSAVLGYLIMFVAYWIIRIIEVVFGVDIWL